MARVRSIHPAATLDEDVATMSMAARLLWAYLPCHADREGRLKDSPFALKAAVFPADTIDVDAVLGELAARQHILRYEVVGKRYIQIRNFARYQNPHVKEKVSEIPAPVLPGAGPVLSLVSPDARTAIPGPDPGPESIPGPERSPEASPSLPADPIWPADEWLRVFKLAWEAKGIVGATAFYGMTSDAKAGDTLAKELARLPRDERLRAQGQASAMLATFFATKGREIEQRKYPFSFFVQAFGDLRMSCAKTAPQAPPRPEESSVPYPLRVRTQAAPKLPQEPAHADP